MNNKIQFHRYTPVGDALKLLLKQYGLDREFNCRRIYAAWDAASGAKAYTVRKYFREGKLYVTVNSSVLQSQLFFQRRDILRKINELLRDDELFSGNGDRTNPVKELIIK